MSPRHLEATLHRQDVCVLGEGPFWHEEQLWWVDIERGLLLSVDAEGNLKETFSFGQRIGAAVPTLHRTFLVALEREIAHLHPVSRLWEILAQPALLPVGSRFNDGKCDPRGRWLIGTLSMKGDPKVSALYSLGHDRSLLGLKEEVTLSNGLAWSADGQTLYHIDTSALAVFAYDYDLDTGTISQERIALRFDEKEGWPDGMCIDREGRLWIGFWDGWTVRCYQPQTGACEAIVHLPCSRPTSCCFGGAGLDRLYITTARVGLTEDELLKQPLAGSLFVCDPETTGFPTSLFTYDHHQNS